MAYFIYLMADHTHKHLHAGYCKDIIKAIDFYKEQEMMSLYYPTEKYLTRLVYLTEVTTEKQAIEGFEYFNFMPITEKIKEVINVNPGWIELIPGVNIEL